MKITKIRLQNIRSFEDTGEISLSKKITVLIGTNNSGKSTILRAIGIIQADSPGLEMISSEDMRIGQNSGNIYLRAINADPYLKSNANNIIESQTTDKDAGFCNLRMGLKAGNAKEIMGLYQAGWDKIPILQNREPGNFIYPYFSKRKVLGFSEEINISATQSITGSLRNLYAHIDRLSAPSHPNHAEFSKMCRDILGMEIATFPSANGKKAGIIIDMHKNIEIESIGEGVPNMLGLLVYLCFAKDKLFLIEELENDLHPKALKMLLEIIIAKSEYNQFVLTTHSNIVLKYLGSLPEAGVLRIDMDIKDRIPTSTVTYIGKSPIERKHVLDHMGYDLADFDLWSAWLFLEESSAERIIRDLLIPWFVPSLKGKLRTVAACGVDDIEPRFTDFNRLFLFAHLEETYKNSAWVIADGDEAGKKVIDQLKKKYKPSGWNEDNFTCFGKPAFEMYYPEIFAVKVEAILCIQNKKEKRMEKEKLLNEVIDWAKKNEEKAKTEFEESANEVIGYLSKIKLVMVND